MNRNSAKIWFPAVEKAGLPVPRTLMLNYDHRLIAAACEGEASAPIKAEIDRVNKVVLEAATQIGFPVFIRTDLTSAKHSGPRNYCARTSSDLARVVYRTIEDSELKLMFAPCSEALMVRQFLDLPGAFTAFGGLPISREYRFFADGKRVICHHPYWPEEAFDEFSKAPASAKELLARLYADAAPQQLFELAVKAAAAVGDGAWSIDFAQDRSGKFWLLDMARAEDSYHFPGCQFREGGPRE